MATLRKILLEAEAGERVSRWRLDRGARTVLVWLIFKGRLGADWPLAAVRTHGLHPRVAARSIRARLAPQQRLGEGAAIDHLAIENRHLDPKVRWAFLKGDASLIRFSRTP